VTRWSNEKSGGETGSHDDEKLEMVRAATAAGGEHQRLPAL
jgi:hypothetical protein